MIADILSFLYEYVLINGCYMLTLTLPLYGILGAKKGRFFTLGTIIFYISVWIVAYLFYDIASTVSGFVSIIEGMATALIYSFIFCKGSAFQKLLISFLTNLIMILISYISMYTQTILFSVPVAEIMGNTPTHYISCTVVNAIYILADYLLIKIVNKKHIISKIKRTELIAIVISFMISSITSAIVLSIFYRYSEQFTFAVKVYLIACLVAIILFNILLYYFIYRISKQNRIESENEMLKIENEYREKHYEEIKVQHEQIRKLRHDSKSSLSVLRSLIISGKTDKAIEFIDKSAEEIGKINTFIKTNNDIVNAVVNTKLSAAQAAGIKVTALSVSDFGDIDSYDLCHLIGNLLDNAVCAAKQSDEKKLSFKAIQSESRLTIQISNSIDNSVTKSNPELLTTKSDKLSHGLGLKIVKDIADKYNASTDFYEKDNEFNFIISFVFIPTPRQTSKHNKFQQA